MNKRQVSGRVGAQDILFQHTGCLKYRKLLTDAAAVQVLQYTLQPFRFLRMTVGYPVLEADRVAVDVHEPRPLTW